MQAYDPNKVKVSESIAFHGRNRRPLDHQKLEVEPYDRGLERVKVIGKYRLFPATSDVTS